jgi:hypothetical protein
VQSCLKLRGYSTSLSAEIRVSGSDHALWLRMSSVIKAEQHVISVASFHQASKAKKTHHHGPMAINMTLIFNAYRRKLKRGRVGQAGRGNGSRGQIIGGGGPREGAIGCPDRPEQSRRERRRTRLDHLSVERTRRADVAKFKPCPDLMGETELSVEYAPNTVATYNQ